MVFSFGQRFVCGGFFIDDNILYTTHWQTLERQSLKLADKFVWRFLMTFTVYFLFDRNMNAMPCIK